MDLIDWLFTYRVKMLVLPDPISPARMTKQRVKCEWENVCLTFEYMLNVFLHFNLLSIQL